MVSWTRLDNAAERMVMRWMSEDHATAYATEYPDGAPYSIKRYTGPARQLDMPDGSAVLEIGGAAKVGDMITVKIDKYTADYLIDVAREEVESRVDYLTGHLLGRRIQSGWGRDIDDEISTRHSIMDMDRFRMELARALLAAGPASDLAAQILRENLEPDAREYWPDEIEGSRG